MMEQLNDIGIEVTGHDFRIESWEIARKDGGVFLHYSYLPPDPASLPADSLPDISYISAPPEGAPDPTNPGRLFLPQLLNSAKKHGGFPSWLGQWWANFGSQNHSIPGHRVWARGGAMLQSVGEEGDANRVKATGSGMTNVQAAAGGGRVWVVKGRQWIEVSVECNRRDELMGRI